jgi:hypothetical protein
LTAAQLAHHLGALRGGQAAQVQVDMSRTLDHRPRSRKAWGGAGLPVGLVPAAL